MELGVLQWLESTPRSVYFNDWNDEHGFYYPSTSTEYGGVYQITRITGADGAEVRTPTLNRPQRDGGIAFPFWRGGRQFTLEGLIIGNTPGDRWKMETHLKYSAQSFLRASLGNRLYKWVPPCKEQCDLAIDDRFGDEGIMMIRCFLSGPLELDMDTAATRSFAIPLYSPDPYILSEAENHDVVSGSSTVTNAGTAPSWPDITFTCGASTSASLANASADPNGFYEALELVFANAAGIGTLDISMFNETVYSGSDPALSYIDPTGSDFWQLYPGDNTINVSGGTADIYHRYAWS